MKKYVLILLVISTACKTTKTTTVSADQQPSNTTINGKLYSALFMQKAAEYRALCFQAFNIARVRIDMYKPTTALPKAIITDIDETILDNSPYAVHRGLKNTDYEPASWFEWTDKAIADTIPGAGSLLRYAASKGIEVFYITNREEKERSSTMNNLRRLGLPNTDDKHLLLKQTSSGKEPRRQQVMATHEIILLMGDNLADFSTLYDKKNSDQRKQVTDSYFTAFGDKFIVLPNPNYGDWETSLWNYKYNFTTAQKDSIIRANLSGY